ncbi:MAG TPA: glycosyltransferase family 39 protein [Bryobacteraceae bacterium]|nr:glycosyltransferase family 39 protein [Bryobacteraceae bacterium]
MPNLRKSFAVSATSLPLILFAALALRMGFAWHYQSQFPRQALRIIPFLFESGNIAHSIATGGGFASPFRVDTGPTAWTTPVYPLLLGGVMRVFGPYTFHSYAAAVLLNILFSTAVCVPLFCAAKRIGGVRLAAGAAWLWAVFPNAILLTYESLWETSLSALLGASLLWATLAVAESRSRRAWAGYGLLWGLALMTNAVLVALLPILLPWAAWAKRQAAAASIALGMVVLCCAPWTVRNYAVFHSFVPLRSILGLQLWVGNNPQANVIWLGEQHPIHDSAERRHYVEIGEIAYMREKERAATRYMLAHPRHEFTLISGRFVAFWAGGSASPLKDFATARSNWFRYVLIFNLAVALGALAGLGRMVRARSVYLIPVAVFPVVLPWAYYLTLALPRYRHPIDPVLMLLAATAVVGVHTCASTSRD